MRHWTTIFLILTLLILGSCSDFPNVNGEQEETKAKDYYPVIPDGQVMHWGQNTHIKFRLPTTPDEPGITTSGYTDSFRTAFMDGVNLWTSILAEVNITFEFVTSGENDVKVLWADNSATYNGFTVIESGVLGFSAVSFSTSYFGASRFIVIATECDVCPLPLSYDNIKSTVAHEVGHMFGLWGHSFDQNDLMYPLDMGQTAPTNRDHKTLTNFLYSFIPNYNMKTDFPANQEFTAPSYASQIDPSKQVFIKISCSFGVKGLSDYSHMEFNFPH